MKMLEIPRIGKTDEKATGYYIKEGDGLFFLIDFLRSLIMN
jgi:hypothetical protein